MYVFGCWGECCAERSPERLSSFWKERLRAPGLVGLLLFSRMFRKPVAQSADSFSTHLPFPVCYSHRKHYHVSQNFFEKVQKLFEDFSFVGEYHQKRKYHCSCPVRDPSLSPYGRVNGVEKTELILIDLNLENPSPYIPSGIINHVAGRGESRGVRIETLLSKIVAARLNRYINFQVVKNQYYVDF